MEYQVKIYSAETAGRLSYSGEAVPGD